MKLRTHDAQLSAARQKHAVVKDAHSADRRPLVNANIPHLTLSLFLSDLPLV